MYVCLCKAVSDSDIQQALNNGAQNLQQISRQLGVGQQCGQCVCQARELIAEHHAKQDTNDFDLGIALPNLKPALT